jgi:hypothetical protein
VLPLRKSASEQEISSLGLNTTERLAQLAALGAQVQGGRKAVGALEGRLPKRAHGEWDRGPEGAEFLGCWQCGYMMSPRSSLIARAEFQVNKQKHSRVHTHARQGRHVLVLEGNIASDVLQKDNPAGDNPPITHDNPRCTH